MIGVVAICINNEKVPGFGTLPITVGKTYEGSIEDFGNGTTYYLIEDEKTIAEILGTKP